MKFSLSHAKSSKSVYGLREANAHVHHQVFIHYDTYSYMVIRVPGSISNLLYRCICQNMHLPAPLKSDVIILFHSTHLTVYINRYVETFKYVHSLTS